MLKVKTYVIIENTDLFFALINKDIKNFEEIKNKFSQYAL